MFKSIEEIMTFCKDNQIKMIDFKMTDINGNWRHVTIPVSRLNADTFKYGIGFDASNYGYASVEKSDMVFVPIIESAVVDPFAKVPTLVMVGDVMLIGETENKPFGQYPRNVAKAAMDFMRKSGVADEMIIGPEYEFNVFDNVSFNTTARGSFVDLDTFEAEWNTDVEGANGMQNAHKGAYHADIPKDITYDLRSEMCDILEDLGVKVKYHHHEVAGPGQVEIEVELGDMVKMADNTMTVKYVIKNAAARDGKCATLMPKPIYGEAGNGMHVHILLKKDGKSVFYDEKGYSKLSKTAHLFIGGLLKHAKSLCAITDASTNSYKRLVPGFEAPVTIGYATSNRSAVVRIPAYASPETRRFELRFPDATCNPYYAYAAILMAGMDGIINNIDPKDYNWGPFDFNLYTLSDEEKAKLEGLPESFGEALDALEQDHDYLTAGGVFPEELIKLYVARKRAEVKEINKIPTPIEFDKYF